MGKYLDMLGEGESQEPELEEKTVEPHAPRPCWKCGAPMTLTWDIEGRTLFVCWECAVRA